MTTKTHYAAGPDSTGATHTRSSISTGKTFAYCVVARKDWEWNGQPRLSMNASWASRLDLAHKIVADYSKRGWQVEMLEARVLEKALPSKNSIAL